MNGVFCQIQPTLFSAEFFSHVREYLHDIGRPILGWDLETGANPRAKQENPWAISQEKFALHAFSSRIYLSGFLDHEFQYHPLFNDEDEAALLRQTASRLERAYEEGAIIVGHNLLKFDFRLFARRYTLLTGHKPAGWFQAEWFNSRSLRIVDTAQLISRGEFGSAIGTTSLSRLVRLWGRDDVSHGATFGAQWETGDARIRKELMEYTRWNLIDSLLLAVFSGVLRPFAETRGLRPLRMKFAPCPFQPSGYRPIEYPTVAEFKLAPAPFSVGFLLTSPTPDLLAKGPQGDEWKAEQDNLVQKDRRRMEEKLSGLTRYGLNLNEARSGLEEKYAKAAQKELDKKKAEFPLKRTGRYRPAHCRVVGYAFLAAGSTEPEIVLAPETEGPCLVRFVDRLHAAKAQGHLYTYSWEAARSLLLYRGSLYGLAWEPWVLGFDEERAMRDSSFYGSDEMMDCLTHYAQERRLVPVGAKIEEPPLYYVEEDKDLFIRQVRGYIRLLAAHIADSPALPGIQSLVLDLAA